MSALSPFPSTGVPELIPALKTEPIEVCERVYLRKVIVERLKSEEEQKLYADHEIKEEIVIGPTEVQRPALTLHPDAAPNLGIGTSNYLAKLANVLSSLAYDSKLLFPCKVELTDVRDKLQCLQCRQWCLTANELRKHKQMHSRKIKKSFDPRVLTRPSYSGAIRPRRSNAGKAVTNITTVIQSKEQEQVVTLTKDSDTFSCNIKHNHYKCKQCQERCKSIWDFMIHQVGHKRFNLNVQRTQTSETPLYKKYHRRYPKIRNRYHCAQCNQHFRYKSTWSKHQVGQYTHYNLNHKL